ncbi:PREDICTED: heparan sulfate 2-O-sulfotransferase 1-like [Ceratosolen solmsi marchali]|uniref:Heparan sulfate 2-O-sulfotransferase 1-like n=1 Tax=Ceratosolen solmsi marchali TaxID=326594 RepID=A0AAJ6YHY5_9HYME|nr:PREDICTED: heparan sulfate 2-O-sulfotransferase 1-like [Ceratosolen solmsi marchali]
MRKYRGVSLFGCLALTMAFLVLATRLVLVEDEAEIAANEEAEVYGAYRTEDSYESGSAKASTRKTEKQTQRYVTRSLAELGNRALIPETNEHVMMVTRVPGSGSELLVLLLQHLQGYNAFKHIRLPPGDEGTLSSLQQELLVEEITSIIRQEAIPLSFDGDVRFLNFSAFGRQSPTYVSLVRDPLDPKTLDRFKRGDSVTIYRGSICHFCGHDSRCSERNNAWALQQAKANVLKWYPIVGILDHMNQTVKSLEVNFPYFFEGASLMYEKIRPKKKNFFNNSTILKPLTKKHLMDFLKLEVEFYEWLKSRLLNSTSENV